MNNYLQIAENVSKTTSAYNRTGMQQYISNLYFVHMITETRRVLGGFPYE
jgi:hypothetical protein